MPVIKIHVEHEELAAIKRRAGELGLTVEALAYGAINCSMSHVKEAYCRVRIDQAASERGHDLPLWSDSARSVAIYESMPDIQQGPGPKGGPLEPGSGAKAKVERPEQGPKA
jgi:hypothetical protein